MSKLNSTIKNVFRELIPPLLWKGIRKIRNSLKSKTTDYIEWEYIPEGWERQNQDSNIKGWNIESVLEAYKANWPTFIKNLETTLPFGISPESSSEERANIMFHNIVITYGYVLALTSRQKSELSLLDWGGGIGHYYLISQKLIPDLIIDYHCKDVPILAEYGQELFPKAHFYSDESCLSRKFDLVFASTSLHYSQNWQHTLKGLAEATSGYLFITRLPIVHQVASYVMVQRPYEYGYNTEYLGWCLNKDEFLQQFEIKRGTKMVNFKDGKKRK
jgi:putative methyltransferase (TIGR04325 family)